MRRIRTMAGELIDRKYAVRDYKNNVIDLRYSIQTIGGSIASNDDPAVIKTYFNNYEIVDKCYQLVYIEHGITRVSHTTLSEIHKYNNDVFSAPEINGTDNLVHLNPDQYTFKSMAKELGYYYHMVNECYVRKEVNKALFSTSNKEFRKFDNTVKYDPKKLPRSRFFGTASPTNLITEGNNTKFGVELETADGFLTLPNFFDLNVKCVYDGSLKDSDGHAYGGEYVTGILRGDLGFNQVNKICKELIKVSTINSKCGMHVHVNVVPTNLFIVNLYKLLLLIEDEMFSYIPKSRRNGPHSKVLPELPSLNNLSLNLVDRVDREFITNHYYNWIRTSVANKGADQTRLPSHIRHPMGDKCNYDKSTMRYCWVNFVPALFIRDGYKGDYKTYEDYTIEFRSHPGTLNFTKTKNWIKLCLAIIKYAENNQDLIFKPEGYKLTVDQIIKFCYPKSKNNMISYFSERAALFSDDIGEKTDTSLDSNNSSVDNGLKKLINI